jgi:hypothetical protein
LPESGAIKQIARRLLSYLFFKYICTCPSPPAAIAAGAE